MRNQTKASSTRSIRRRSRMGTENLTAPSVPVADPIDGLIKTADLLNDVDVLVTVWPGATENDEIVLKANGVIVGEPFKLGPNPVAGSVVTLQIPTGGELKQDGIYTIVYTVAAFPGGNKTDSPAINIEVDRTPPGAHQLGFMDFPEETADGLTAEELAAMGDVLVGKIFGYTGLSKGDTIYTTWGESAGPELILTKEESGEEALEIEFTKSFLLSVEKNTGPTFYIVKDRAGNISQPSNKVTIPLFLTEVVTDLPAPVVESYDGLIDYEDASSGVEVKIPSSEILGAGDQITLHWGTVAVGPFPFDPEDITEPYVLAFDIALSSIEQAGNGSRQLRYDVVRDGRIIGVSELTEIIVNTELPVPGMLDKPTIRGASGTPSAEDNVIDENDFELDATVLINWNNNFAAGQRLNVYWGGREVLQGAYEITNTDVAAGRGLLLTALNSEFKLVGTGEDIRVRYTVTIPGNPNLSTSTEQGISVRSKDDLPGGGGPIAAPEFLMLNENGAINDENSINGAPVHIKPFINIGVGQVIVFRYDAYDDLVGGALKFSWSHTSAALSETNVTDGYDFAVPRNELQRHCFGHVEASFQVISDKGRGNSGSASVYVDLRHAGVCQL